MKKLIALLLALSLIAALAGCSKPTEADPTGGTTATTPTTAPTEPALKIEDLVPGEGVFTKVSYSVSDEDASAARLTNVATCGDATLTNGTLQFYYWMAVYEFLNEYGGYASYFGLDYTKPLDEQICPETEGTWQHSFLQDAISSWQSYQAMALMGKKNEIPMKEDLQTALDELSKTMEDAAKENKYESVDAMLQADVGTGATFEEYYKYMEVYYQGYSYFDHMYQSFDVSEEDIEAYFTKNEEAMKENGYTKDAGDYYDVRHILIQPEGGTKDNKGNTTFSDAEWESCRQKAQKLLDDWLAGEATEDTFAELATKNSMDGGSSSNGGLYQYLTKDTNFVQEFKDWYLDESRQAGDTGLVKTSHGYHIMYFSGTEEIWHAQCRDAILNEKSQKVMEDAVKEFPVSVTYGDVVLGVVDLNTEK